MEQIMRQEKSAASIICKLSTHHGLQAYNLMLTKDVLGIVARLGKVDDDNLSRSNWLLILFYFISSIYLGIWNLLWVNSFNFHWVLMKLKVDMGIIPFNFLSNESRIEVKCFSMWFRSSGYELLVYHQRVLLHHQTNDVYNSKRTLFVKKTIADCSLSTWEWKLCWQLFVEHMREWRC